MKGGKVYGSGPGSRLINYRKDAIWRSPPTSAMSSAEVAVRHLGVKDARAVFPGYAISATRFPGFLS